MATIFTSGWENAPGTSCDVTNITDDGAWDDFGPSGTCSASPAIALLSTSEVNSGSRSLRVHFKDGDGANGPDFRIVHDFGATYPELYYRWMQKWDSNWRWSPGNDHKMLITGPPPEQQVIYFNLRGHTGGASAYPAIHIITPDTVVSDQSVVVSPGEWVRFEMGIRWGSGGWVRARINGNACTLTTEAGNEVDPENTNPGSNGGFVKLDTTYNNFTYFEANVSGNAANCYYDDVLVDDADWPGAVGGGGSSTGKRGRFRLRFKR